MIRPELNGKLIILGFLGMCPNVDVRLATDQPSVLTFLLSGQFDRGNHKISIEIVDVENQNVIAAAEERELNVKATRQTMNMAPTLLLTFGHAGDFLVRCTVDGVNCYSGAFSVSSAAQPQG